MEKAKTLADIKYNKSLFGNKICIVDTKDFFCVYNIKEISKVTYTVVKMQLQVVNIRKKTNNTNLFYVKTVIFSNYISIFAHGIATQH